MPKSKKTWIDAKKCAICARSTRDEKTLGPFIETDTIAAHYKCVLFNSVAPEKVDFAADGINGVSSRFIRSQGKRALPLVIFPSVLLFFLKCNTENLQCNPFFSFKICVYCKRGGANIGCCRDIGDDTVPKFCRRRYHVDCGLEKRASFTISSNCGPVSLCFEHRDLKER